VRRRHTVLSALALVVGAGLAAVPVGAVASAGAAEATAASGLAGVSVSGAAGTAPTVTFTPPLAVTKTTTEVVAEGDGARTKAGQTVLVQYVLYNGRTGAQIESTYATPNTPVALPLDKKQALPSLVKALTGKRVGDRVLVAFAPSEGLTANAPADSGVLADDTLLFAIDVVGDATPLERATGTKVAPVSGLPTVKLSASGEPTITIPKGQAPTSLVVQPLIEGEGPVVTAGQTVTVHYRGVLWRDGSTFDSSWKRKQPAKFGIGTGQVIAGWDSGIVGQHVGSQLLLVIPPDQGYGSTGQPSAGIKGTDTLVFVVDILAAA
jgi:peptidylprolyl isomerase